MKSSTKYLKIIINYIFAIALVLGCIYVLPKLISFFMPFIIAWIIAMMANPLVMFLDRKLKIKRKAGSVVVIILTLALVILVCYGVIWVITSQVAGFITSMPGIWARLVEVFQSLNREINRYFYTMPISVQNGLGNVGEKIAESMTEIVSGMGSSAAEVASNSVKNFPSTLIGIVMGVLASYSFVAERDYLSNLFHSIAPKSMIDRMELVTNTMKGAVGGYFKAQFKIMAVVYVCLLIGLLILRVDYAVLIAFLIALLDFLPFFGTGTAMWPWAFVAFVQKDYTFAVGMLIVWGASQLVRQIIQPKVLGDSVGMPAIPTLFLLYIGFKVGGALGLIVSVPLGMIAYNLYKAGVFSNFLYSTRILLNDLKRIRVYTDEELESEGISVTQTGAGNIAEDEQAASSRES